MNGRGRAGLRRFKPYPAYKDPGVEWLGEIPTHWELKRLKYLATTNDEALPEGTDPGFEITYVDISSVDALSGITATETLPFERAPSRARRIVRDGDVIVSMVRTYLRGIAPIQKPGPNLIVSTGFAVVRPRCLDSSFAAYALRAPYFVDRVVANSVGVSYPAIDASTMSAFPIAFPGLTEQRAIAAFLDRETARIDTLVANKERLIERLQEKRTALITQAVTKGLDPNVAMKDSGLEWLGKIPAHWEVKRVKDLSQFVTSGSRGWANYYADGGSLFLRIGNLRAGAIDLDLTDVQHVRPPKGAEGERTRVRNGDVLISITALIGAVGVAPDGIPEAFVNQHLALVRPMPKSVDPRWLGYCVLSRVGQEQMSADLYGGTKDGLGLEDVRSLVALLPPRGEQRHIVESLDAETRRTDSLILKIRDGIERLKDLRAALISAAVTGKIDVREGAA